MDETNLIQFELSKIPARPSRTKDFCRHLYVVVCEKTRMLECDKCGQVIDPFDYMWEWANCDRNLAGQRDIMKKEIKRLNADLAELKKDERNTKARLKRMNINVSA